MRHVALSWGTLAIVIGFASMSEAQVQRPGFGGRPGISNPAVGAVRNQVPRPGIGGVGQPSFGGPGVGSMNAGFGNMQPMGTFGAAPMGGVPFANSGFGGAGLGGFNFSGGGINSGMPAGFGAGNALPYLNLLRGGNNQLNYMSLVAPQLLQNRRAQQQQLGLQQLQFQLQQQQQQLPVLLQNAQQQGQQQDVAQTGAGTHTLYMQRKTVEQGISPAFMNSGGYFPGNRY